MVVHLLLLLSQGQQHQVYNIKSTGLSTYRGIVRFLNYVRGACTVIIYDDDSFAVNNSPLAVTMKTYDMPSAIRDGIISAFNDEDSSAFTIVTTAIIKMTTVFHESPSAIHVEMPYAVNDGISSAAIADKAQCDYYDSDTAVSRVSPSIVIDTESSIVSVSDAVTSTPSSAVSVVDEATFTPVTNMSTVFNSRTVDNVFDLYFDTIFDTLSLVYNDNDHDSFCPSSTGNNERSSVAVTTNIQCWKGHAFFFDL